MQKTSDLIKDNINKAKEEHQENERKVRDDTNYQLTHKDEIADEQKKQADDYILSQSDREEAALDKFKADLLKGIED